MEPNQRFIHIQNNIINYNRSDPNKAGISVKHGKNLRPDRVASAISCFNKNTVPVSVGS